jgi:hypothetical protein
MAEVTHPIYSHRPYEQRYNPELDPAAPEVDLCSSVQYKSIIANEKTKFTQESLDEEIPIRRRSVGKATSIRHACIPAASGIAQVTGELLQPDASPSNVGRFRRAKDHAFQGCVSLVCLPCWDTRARVSHENANA